MVWVQAVLDGLGAVLALIFDQVPNYGVAIILLTLGIRVLLLPLGVKQIRSMHAMQAIQPKVKALQQKYKGNRQKVTEETMKLYREHRVNPWMGCLPLLAQFPVLIALFLVLQVPGNGLSHIPDDSRLEAAIRAQDTEFLGVNLLCAASQAGGGEVELPPGQPQQLERPLNCGQGFPVRIPYYLYLLAMVGTTFYQTWQMQRASPGGNPQQQLIGRIMPVFMGFIGFTFPAGLVLYWTTTNLVQIGQQHFMLPKKGERAVDEAQKGAGDSAGSAPAGRSTRSGGSASNPRRPRTPGSTRSDVKGGDGGRRRAPEAAGDQASARAGSDEKGAGGSGGRRGGNRKKRRKR
ncbi:MAG: YidC/Oxa1 family membrane protein insertase [Actinomycetota bacterium]